jgi:hypothetical protein
MLVETFFGPDRPTDPTGANSILNLLVADLIFFILMVRVIPSEMDKNLTVL